MHNIIICVKDNEFHNHHTSMCIIDKINDPYFLSVLVFKKKNAFNIIVEIISFVFLKYIYTMKFTI